ncbi:hypothetical protein MXB_2499 [Myxobolus squamalis]|nr:hypothetical protein MXB_2499 [Myxobolus squamalis]
MRKFLLGGCSPLRLYHFPCRYSSSLRNIRYDLYETRKFIIKDYHWEKSIFFKQLSSNETNDRFSKFSDLIQRNLAKFGIQLDKNALKRKIKIVVAIYVILSALMFSGIYWAISYG